MTVYELSLTQQEKMSRHRLNLQNAKDAFQRASTVLRDAEFAHDRALETVVEHFQACYPCKLSDDGKYLVSRGY